MKASLKFYYFCAGKHWDNDQLYQLRLLDFKGLQKQHRHVNNISHRNLNKLDTLEKNASTADIYIAPHLFAFHIFF